MGQYYKPVNLEKNQFVLSHDYDNGLKLMEHSYIGNNFVGVVESLIAKGGAWHGNSIVWAGDYADNENGLENNLYGLAENKINPVENKKSGEFKYLINLTKKEYVDINKIPTFNEDDWKIHPLPLLTCEGNGQGGGDFHGNDKNKIVGSWARDVVIVADELNEDLKEIIFDLVG